MKLCCLGLRAGDKVVPVQASRQRSSPRRRGRKGKSGETLGAGEAGQGFRLQSEIFITFPPQASHCFKSLYCWMMQEDIKKHIMMRWNALRMRNFILALRMPWVILCPLGFYFLGVENGGIGPHDLQSPRSHWVTDKQNRRDDFSVRRVWCVSFHMDRGWASCLPG